MRTRISEKGLCVYHEKRCRAVAAGSRYLCYRRACGASGNRATQAHPSCVARCRRANGCAGDRGSTSGTAAVAMPRRSGCTQRTRFFSTASCSARWRPRSGSFSHCRAGRSSLFWWRGWACLLCSPARLRHWAACERAYSPFALVPEEEREFVEGFTLAIRHPELPVMLSNWSVLW